MNHESDCVIVSLMGENQTGIVARVAHILFQTGCNIEDSSMTRLRGEFTIMLILRLGKGISPEALRDQLASVTQSLNLTLQIKSLTPPETERTFDSETSNSADSDTDSVTDSDTRCICLIHVLGGDRAGIVYRVTQILHEEGGDITDLKTQIVGSSKAPVYAMMIETTVPNANFQRLQSRLARAAQEMDVEINVRTPEIHTL